MANLLTVSLANSLAGLSVILLAGSLANLLAGSLAAEGGPATQESRSGNPTPQPYRRATPLSWRLPLLVRLPIHSPAPLSPTGQP